MVSTVNLQSSISVELVQPRWLFSCHVTTSNILSFFLPQNERENILLINHLISDFIEKIGAIRWEYLSLTQKYLKTFYKDLHHLQNALYSLDPDLALCLFAGPLKGHLYNQ